MKRPLLSVIIPCYNEAATLPLILDQVEAVDLDKEIIIVDDHSTDETPAILEKLRHSHPHITVIRHPHNRGKGAAVRSGLAHARGEITIVQDADLEYDPQDYYELVKPIASGRVDVVFGSRFLGRHTGMYFWNALGNKFLTFLTNFLFNCWISDMETCYKVTRTDILRDLQLESNDFRIEPEITAKVLRRGYRIYEVPVSYLGRTYEEGKKMKPIQGFYAIWTLFKYRFWW
ncbi:MAG: glycosyltransferase family 2 protein [Chloroflexus sp.]|uniref:glycosyltransferase family 2 protein n=1 Tax=Chloroflexus sp. TaxID=1904827 RepID=UPI0040493754